MDIKMVDIECATCYIPFSITARMHRELLKCHNAFYCPNGHPNYYFAKSEEEKLKDRIDEKNKVIADLQLELDKKMKKTSKNPKKASNAK